MSLFLRSSWLSEAFLARSQRRRGIDLPWASTSSWSWETPWGVCPLGVSWCRGGGRERVAVSEVDNSGDICNYKSNSQQQAGPKTVLVQVMGWKNAGCISRTPWSMAINLLTNIGPPTIAFLVGFKRLQTPTQVDVGLSKNTMEERSLVKYKKQCVVCLCDMPG